MESKERKRKSEKREDKPDEVSRHREALATRAVTGIAAVHTWLGFTLTN